MDTCIEIARIMIITGLHMFKYFIGIQSYNNSVINLSSDLVKINIIYAKILQWDIYKIFSSNDYINNHLKQYTNNVPFDTDDIDYTLLHKIEEYAIQQNIKLTINNNLTPINCGTVALVFKGMLNDKPVAIKILRKNIYSKIERGLRTIINFIKIINFIVSIFYNINDNTINIVNSNKKILLQQMDFKEEIKNNELFAKAIKAYDYMKIPYIYKSFTNDVSNEVIIMEFLEGTTLSDLDNDEKFKQMYKHNITKFILDSYINHKIAHADLHTGNIIFTNNQIGLIDFGLVVNLTDKDTKNITDIFFSIKNKNYNRLISSIGKLLSEDTVFLAKFRDICLSSGVLLPIVSDNCNCTSKVFANVLKIFNDIQISTESSGPILILSIISSFSTIELLNGNNTPFDKIFTNFFSEFK